MTTSVPHLPHLPHPRRLRRLRRAAVGGGIALAALTTPLLAVLPGPAQAATGTATVQFTGCEVRDTSTDAQIGPETTWSPTLSLTMPTPVASGDSFTMDVDLGDLPANLLPADMTDVDVHVWKLELVSEHWLPLNFYDEFHLATLDKDIPLAFPNLEYDYDYVDPGIYHQRAKSVLLYFQGKVAGTDKEYSFACDQVVNPQPILTIAVYDLNATPELVLDRTTAQPGQSVGFTGTNLLTVAPTMPRAQASVTVGGIPAGTVEIDDSGAVQGSFIVPAGLSGTVEVRVSNGAKSASQMLQLTAGPGLGGVDVNNPATWHPNAQSDVVDNQAKLKVAAKKVRSGKKLKLGGSGFAPGEAVILKARTAKGKGARLFTKVVYANASGAIKANLKLKRAAKGTWRVTAIGVASGHGGVAKFKVR